MNGLSSMIDESIAIFNSLNCIFQIINLFPNHSNMITSRFSYIICDIYIYTCMYIMYTAVYFRSLSDDVIIITIQKLITNLNTIQ